MTLHRKWRMDELEARAQERRATDSLYPLIIVCADIRSALNVGSIFRTADAFGAAALWLCGITAQPPHREILKTALGATATVPWTYCTTAIEAAATLRDRGFALIGLEQTTASCPLPAYSWPPQSRALFLGNEVSGLADDLLPLMDDCLEIPQMGTKHSLNVAVAAGIAIWECQKPAFPAHL